MRSLVFFGTVVFALALSFVLVGFCSPIEQSSEMSKQFSCSKETLWDQVTSIELFPEIKDEVYEVKLISENESKKWVEYSKIGAKRVLEVEEEIPGEKLVVKIFDPSLDIEKTRIYSFFGDEHASVLSIKEFVRVEKILLRSTMAISGHKHSIKKELDEFADYITL